MSIIRRIRRRLVCWLDEHEWEIEEMEEVPPGEWFKVKWICWRCGAVDYTYTRWLPIEEEETCKEHIDPSVPPVARH